MKKIFLTALLSTMLFASIRVDTTYSTFGAIVKKIGGDLVKVTVLGSPKYDPHFIVPKPSLISKLRRADLLIMNGGGLELGWLPPLLRSANNPKIQPGSNGFLDMSQFIDFIDKPSSVSRGFGDIHAQGNPHYSSDPHLVSIMARVIAKKLEIIDSSNEMEYKSNLAKFLKEWKQYLSVLDSKMSSCKGEKVIEYHELYNYFFKQYGIISYGDIEPLPGITPSSKHTIKLIKKMRENGVKLILQDVYHEKKTAKFIASKTGAKVQIIPHDVGSVEGSDTLKSFYSTIANRICP